MTFYSKLWRSVNVNKKLKQQLHSTVQAPVHFLAHHHRRRRHHLFFLLLPLPPSRRRRLRLLPTISPVPVLVSDVVLLAKANDPVMFFVKWRVK